MGRFRTLWTTGRIQPYASKETVQELIRVLSGKKFKLNSQEQESLLTDYLPFAQVTNASPRAGHASLPICRDLRDQMFLVLAELGQVDYLVSGDQDLLVLANTSNLPFGILKPFEFLTLHQLLP